MTHDVFISYSTDSKATADDVCSALEANEIRCWIAPRDIRPGVEWAEGIIDGIEGSCLVILILCARSNDSPQVLREVERAVSKRIPIIPFRIEDIPLSKSMEYFISSHHWLDAARPPLAPHVEKLVETVRNFICTEDRHPNRSTSGSIESQVAAPKDGPPAGAPPRKGLSRGLLGGLAAGFLMLVLGVGLYIWKAPSTIADQNTVEKSFVEADHGPAWGELVELTTQAAYPIEITANQERFEIGDPLVITCRATKPGYLNVLSVTEGDDTATVLFPNSVRQDNHVEAETTITIPGPEDGFTLQAQAPAGKSLVVVFHTETPINAYRDGSGAASDLFKTLPQKKLKTRGFGVSTSGSFGSGRMITEVVHK